MAIHLQHTSGDKGDEVETFAADRIRIGRNPDNDLTFDPEQARQVGRYHAEIYRDRDQYFVKDLQSRNGTFVGGRRIDQATAITDGDLIQFAPGGPTLRFSTRPPSAGPDASPNATMVRRPPEEMPAERPGWGRRTIVVLGAAAAGALIFAGALGYYWSSWWVFSSAFVGASAFESMGLYVWTWWRARRERGEARAASESGAATRPQTDTQRDLAERWAEGVTLLRRSNLQQRGEDAVYALPWYLLLGERGAGSSATVRAARPLPSSAAVRRGGGATTTCDWWFFEKCVVLDVTGRYLSQPDQATDGAEWRRFLGLVRRTRARQPLNGVVVTVTAEGLAARGTERLQEAAGVIRRRLDEMGREFGIKFPVYVLATHLDTLAGFSQFFGRLPEDAVDQAMGAMNEDLDGHLDAGAVMEGAVRTIAARLDALRLKILNDIETATLDNSSEGFLFVEEFKTLGRPLRAFTDALFRRNPYHETPLLRGIHFTSTAQDRAAVSRLAERMGLEAPRVRNDATARPFFARHLFAQILPAEGGLVRPTSEWYRRYHGVQLAGILGAAALALALILLFTLSFVRNSQALADTVVDGCRPTAGAPPPAASQPGTSRLLPLEDCREAIEPLIPHSRWARLSFNFGLRHTEQLQGEMREHYLEAARRDVIEPQEARIDKKLQSGQEAPAYVAALLDRIQLLGRCRTGGCSTLADWMSPRYSTMLRADQPGVAEPTIARYARTHASYLRWQPDVAALDRLRGADAERVTRWIRGGGLRPDWILASTSRQFPPVRMKDYWQADTPVVDGAYTASAWTDVLAPLITGLRDIPAEQVETAAALNRFEADYRRDGLRAWGEFVEAFRQQSERTIGRRRDLEFVKWALAPSSPYRRLVDVTAANVPPLARDPGPDVPAWGRTVSGYAALRTKLAEGQKLSPEEQKSRLKQNERDAAANLAAYGQAIEQIKAELDPSEKAYRSALRLVEEGEAATATSAHPVQKARQAVRNLKGLLGENQGGDDLFWSLFDRPVQLGWRAILDQAGIHLQRQWDAVWPEMAALETPAAQRAARTMAFTNDKLLPFLDRRPARDVPKRIIGESVPFTDAFLDYLARARAYAPEGSAPLQPPRVIVTTY